MSASPGSDGGAGGLQLQHVTLVSSNFTAGVNGDLNNPKIFWSNASQTFVINYATPSPAQTTDTNPMQMSISKYTVGGQGAEGLQSCRCTRYGASARPSGFALEWIRRESGNLLGVLSGGGPDTPATSFEIFDQSENLVGGPRAIWPNTSFSGNLAAMAGTASGFFNIFNGNSLVDVNFWPVSAAISAPDAGLRDAGIYSTALTSPDPSAPLAKASDLRAISDDVGTGGQGGVGLALIFGASNGVYFAYLNSDGGGIQGPSPVFVSGGGPGTMSMTNFNGSFAISSYTAATHSAQVIETGICP